MVTKIFPNYLRNFLKYLDSHIIFLKIFLSKLGNLRCVEWDSQHHFCISSRFIRLAIIYIVRRIFVVCRTFRDELLVYIFRDIFSFLYSSDSQGDRYAIYIWGSRTEASCNIRIILYIYFLFYYIILCETNNLHLTVWNSYEKTVIP